jgi:hypothetical protein
LVVPAQVLPALTAKCHAPGIPREPCVFIRGFTKSDGARTGDEGLKIAFDPGGVDENMTVRAAEADEMVGAGDQASARAALESFCSVSADSANWEGKDHAFVNPEHKIAEQFCLPPGFARLLSAEGAV